MARIALVTGIAGQDGYYLSNLLRSKGYVVLRRRPAGQAAAAGAVQAVYSADIGTEADRSNLLAESRPDEVYNLAGMSRVSDFVRASGQFRAGQRRRGDPPLGGDSPAPRAARVAKSAFTRRRRARCSARPATAAPDRNESLSSAQPVRVLESAGPSADDQLSRSLRPVRLLRHPVQSRIAPPARAFRHAQNHLRGGPHQARGARSGWRWAISTSAATGALPAIMSKQCGSCCSRTSRTTT